MIIVHQLQIPVWMVSPMRRQVAALTVPALVPGSRSALSVGWSANSRLLFAGTVGGSIVVFDVQSREPLRCFKCPGGSPPRFLKAHPSVPTLVLVVPWIGMPWVLDWASGSAQVVPEAILPPPTCTKVSSLARGLLMRCDAVWSSARLDGHSSLFVFSARGDITRVRMGFVDDAVSRFHNAGHADLSGDNAAGEEDEGRATTDGAQRQRQGISGSEQRPQPHDNTSDAAGPTVTVADDIVMQPAAVRADNDSSDVHSKANLVIRISYRHTPEPIRAEHGQSLEIHRSNGGDDVACVAYGVAAVGAAAAGGVAGHVDAPTSDSATGAGADTSPSRGSAAVPPSKASTAPARKRGKQPRADAAAAAASVAGAAADKDGADDGASSSSSSASSADFILVTTQKGVLLYDCATLQPLQDAEYAEKVNRTPLVSDSDAVMRWCLRVLSLTAAGCSSKLHVVALGRARYRLRISGRSSFVYVMYRCYPWAMLPSCCHCMLTTLLPHSPP